jgi:hypothetical protein
MPLRHPIAAAKAVASLDCVSNGRLMLGVGTGLLEREPGSLNLGTRRLQALTDEYVQAMFALWEQPVASFHGRYVNFDALICDPKPIQQPHPPLFVGGKSRLALRRCARLGAGWAPTSVTPAEVQQALAAIGGESRPTIVILAPLMGDPEHTSVDQVLDTIAGWTAAGVTGFAIDFSAPDRAALLEAMDWLMRDVRPRLQATHT